VKSRRRRSGTGGIERPHALVRYQHEVVQSIGSVAAGLSLTFVLTACVASAATPLSAKTLIVIDHSIGGVALKDQRSNVERSLGRGFVVRAEDQKPPDPPAHGEQVRYAKYGLDVWYVSRNATPLERARGRVIVVLTHSPRYRTAQGLRVGSTAEALRSIGGVNCFHGSTECQHGYNAVNHPGTTFRLDRPAGVIVQIAIAFGH